MPLGAAVAIGTIDSKGILETAKKTLEAAAASNPSGILVCSCVSRYMQAGEEELAMLAKMMEDGKIPWSLAYSGGEICPVADSAGVLHNRFHNYSFIACAL
jgi:methylmalonyl-CoA mutase cobalamin-binding subunit